MNASDRLLVARAEANAMLHLSRNASYRSLRRSRFFGMVSVADVRRVLDRASRNGAKWSGGELMEIDESVLGISRRSMFRVLKTAPHFRITRKTVLVEKSMIDDFLK